MDWVIPEKEEESGKNSTGNLLLALLVSLLLHSSLLVLLFVFGVKATNPSANRPETVRITLVPAIGEATAETTLRVNNPLPVSGPPQLSRGEPLPPPRSNPEPAVAAEVTSQPDLPEVATEPNQGSEPPVDTEPPLPSRLVMQQLVRSIMEQDNAEPPGVDCNPIQQKSELFDCKEEADPGDWGEQSGFIDGLFAAGRDMDSSAVAQSVISSNSELLKLRLGELSDDPAMRDYIISELDAGISVYGATGNVPLQRLQDQINSRDPAYQQMNRTMNPR